MSFKFNWNFLNQGSLYDRAKVLLLEAMNKDKRLPMIKEDVLIDKLDFGSEAPRLEILEVGDIAQDKFRGIFRLEYSGDATMSLKTTVEANPLASSFKDSLKFASPNFLLASSSLLLPLSIRLSDIRLSAIIILVYSKAKGLTLVFQNDPLQSVTINSTFDFLPDIARFLRQEIEDRFRESFLEDIPEALYQLSQETPEEAVQSHHPFHDTEDYDPKLFDSLTTATLPMKRLASNQQTLSLNTATFIDTITRSTLECFESIINDPNDTDTVSKEEKLKQFNILSKNGASELLCESVAGPSPHHQEITPRRRIVTLNKHKESNSCNSPKISTTEKLKHYSNHQPSTRTPQKFQLKSRVHSHQSPPPPPSYSI